MTDRAYLPALAHGWLNRFYDPVVALTCRESTFRERMLELAPIAPGDSLLDLGCGTGSFAVLAELRHPEADMTGVDADPDILAQARRKARRAGVEVTFVKGMSYDLPFDSEAYDLVFSSLFFHHLQAEDKRRTLLEVHRVLKPDGQIVVCDWGIPGGPYTRLAFNAVRLLDGYQVTEDNVRGRLPGYFREAGFVGVREAGVLATALGSLRFHCALKTGPIRNRVDA